jgi:hypothetical protein
LKLDIPAYWKSFIANLNTYNHELRGQYVELENQIDVILQDESLFNIDPNSFFLSYQEDSKIEEQGFKLRLNLITDTVETFKAKLTEILGD